MGRLRHVLVTGGNRGLGFGIVTRLLRDHVDCFVLLGSRDESRGEVAMRSLVEQLPASAGRVAVVQIDAADQESVKRAAAQVSERFGGEGLHGIINNAGIGPGFSLRRMLDVNMHGPRLVNEAFIPLLQPTGPGRVVHISSASGPAYVETCDEERRRFFADHAGEATWQQLEELMEESLAVTEEAGADGFRKLGLGDGDPYALSKACLNLYTRILSREHDNLHVSSCTPGFIRTGMTQHASKKSGTLMNARPPDTGSRLPVTLAMDEPRGKGWFFGSDGKRSPLDRFRSPKDPAYEGP